MNSPPIRYDQEIPLSQNDFESLRTTLIQLTPELESELEFTIPELEEHLLPADDFEKLVAQEMEGQNSIKGQESLLNEGAGVALQHVGVEKINQILNSISALFTAVQTIQKRPMRWIGDAVYDMLTDKDRPWKELHRVCRDNLQGLKERAARVDRQELNVPQDYHRKKLLQDADDLKRYLDEGGKIRSPWIINNKVVKQNKELITKVFLDGRECNSPQNLEALIELLSVEDAIDYIWNLWKGKAERQSGPLGLQVAELEELFEALTSIVALYDLLESAQIAISEVPGLPEPAWHDINSVLSLKQTCQIVLNKHQLSEVQRQLGVLEQAINTQLHIPNVHKIVRDALNSVRSRDADSYRNVLSRARQFREAVKSSILANEYLSKLEMIAPRLCQELQETRFDEKWTLRIQDINKAWNWMRAKSWLKDFLGEDDVLSLERRLTQIEVDINESLAQLAANLAWGFCFKRMEDSHRRHLMGWQQEIRQYGKGTGKHAHRHLRNAQTHLNKCREAVPAWVMPLHRVWETVEPLPKAFDVIIVDEASQCGPEALPLTYLAKRLLVVGDDQQISPEGGFVSGGAVHHLMQEYLFDFEHADSFNVASSLFDHGKRRFNNRIVLREHFRCMPEIIRFSNDLCYHSTPLIPLRQYPPKRLKPLEAKHVVRGNREGRDNRVINRPEAEEIVKKVAECCRDSQYDGKTMGVIILQGEAQGPLISDLLQKEIGAEEMERRRLICGNPYSFQGDERHVIFLSMVAAPNERIGPFSNEAARRRFNVAASRAQDQMWLFHSATRNDLSDVCLRKQLLDYFENPLSQVTKALGEDAEQLRERAYSANRQIEKAPHPFDSWFEVDVALMIAGRGYRVIPQYPFGGKFIDLVVEGRESQVAVECDGDFWHGPEAYEKDTERQRILERCGWRFERIRECVFNANPEAALEGLWARLKHHRIFPVGMEVEEGPPSVKPEKAVLPELESKEPAGETFSLFSEEEENEDDVADKEIETEAETPEGSESHADLLSEFSGYQAPYAHWNSHALPDPRTASLAEVVQGLMEIISVEGPIFCHRAYFIYARAVDPPIMRVGSQIREIFNSAIRKALRQKLLEGRDEEKTRDLYLRIVRKAGTKAVNVRKCGNRSFNEIPFAETGTVMVYLYSQNPTQDREQLMKATAGRFDVGRMTENIRSRLIKVWERYIS